MKSPLKSVDCELITINFDQSTPSTWHPSGNDCMSTHAHGPECSSKIRASWKNVCLVKHERSIIKFRRGNRCCLSLFATLSSRVVQPKRFEDRHRKSYFFLLANHLNHYFNVHVCLSMVLSDHSKHLPFYHLISFRLFLHREPTKNKIWIYSQIEKIQYISGFEIMDRNIYAIKL